jgi:diguanylate cyclase (GGDEF)-like protein
MTTGYASEYTYEDIISAGATDYLAKPHSLEELRAKIRRIEREKRVLKELKETNERLEAAVERANHMALEAEVAKQDLLVQSRTDPLTGVFNRRAILSQIEIELSRAQRENKKVSLSLLDIDHFKKINDTYGHMVGDDMLREVVKQISAAIRTYDSLGRFGGEEFLIVIPGAKGADAYTIGERIRSAVGETDFSINGSKMRVTVSQGVVTGDGNANVDDLIAMADKAMYQAKDNGRNRVEQTLPQ